MKRNLFVLVYAFAVQIPLSRKSPLQSNQTLCTSVQ
jgi:hypothetical protein